MVFAIHDMNHPWVYMCSLSWTPLQPPSPSHPSGSSQCTSPEHPVSYIEPGLAICFKYDNIHVSILFSQIIPPSPSPTESKSLFYTSVSLLLSLIQSHCYHLSKFHIYALVCFWTVVLEKTLVSALDCKEIQPAHSKGHKSWVFFGRTDAKVETPILWPPQAKSWLIGKDRDAGRDWGQEEKGMTEDGMTGWHHRLNGHESGWTPGVSDGQGGLECCNSGGRKESDTTEWLNWTDTVLVFFFLTSLFIIVSSTSLELIQMYSF